MERIRDNLQVFVENDLARPDQIDETLNRIHGSDQLEVVGGEADFVIEAVIEESATQAGGVSPTGSDLPTAHDSCQQHDGTDALADWCIYPTPR